jgi:hypothetical protein
MYMLQRFPGVQTNLPPAVERDNHALTGRR